MLKGSVNPSDKDINIIQDSGSISKIKAYYILECNDKVGEAAGGPNLMQFHGSKTLVLYTKQSIIMCDYSEVVWVPLPNCPVGYQKFAFVYPCQKEDTDQDFVDGGPGYVIDLEEFREWMENISKCNGMGRYQRMLNLKCS